MGRRVAPVSYTVGGAARGTSAQRKSRGRPNGRPHARTAKARWADLPAVLRRAARAAPPVLGVILLATAAFASVDPSEGPPPALGRTVPEFTLQSVDGGVLRLSDVEEPVVVLNLFAFWCDTWIEQLPQVRELVTQQEALGFRFISISIDGRWPGQLEQVCGDQHPPWPILLDSDMMLAKALGIRHAPTVLVLDQSRRVQHAWEGYPGNHRVLRGIRRTLSKNAQ